MATSKQDSQKKETWSNDHAFPKVLIIGQTFTMDTGGGITLTNLFKKWPKERLAVAVESKEVVDFDKADYYYRIGFQELKMPAPFSFFQRKTKSGAIAESKSEGAVQVKETGSLKFKVKQYFDAALHHTGLYFWMYGREKVSPALIAWIEDFQPDLIYFQPNSYKSLDFILAVTEKIRVALVTHVMDDWFSFVVRSSPVKGYWQKKIDHKAQLLFDRTQLHLSICDYMSQEYERRYGHPFIAFHNCVDLDFWSTAAQNHPLSQPIKILYAGRIGYGLEMILLKMADIVEQMGSEGIAVCLEIQTKDQRHELISTLENYRHVFTSPPVAYEKLPEKFAAADILLIPCDFDGSGVRFLKYSMPTKSSEYMATGRPILVISPAGTALTEYARSGWALLCDSDREADIRKAIQELISSETLREKISGRARELAANNHSQSIVMQRFREALTKLAGAQISLNKKTADGK
ncbi:glycosyltransferase family 4 protein [Mucilaginibacter corticis]|uniref:Glycosyltransferase family 4 protein n=1 Tax=Mucilaginibacter corticis TaxID=2597670 RepID=A0A556MM29_9SPHI|nr:glycosyltransferase [Mucilaginibacter corticis]TSJ40984.1 glycosyltransferase family 4 protein [Mucilaginibacter corticis]